MAPDTQESLHPERAHLIRQRNERLVLRLIFRSVSLSTKVKAVQHTGLKSTHSVPYIFKI